MRFLTRRELYDRQLREALTMRSMGEATPDTGADAALAHHLADF